MPKLQVLGVVAGVVGVAGLVRAGFGADWIEPRDNDAGAFVSLAQVPFEATPGLPLNSIQGVLNSAAPRGGNTQDPQDLFEIYIPAPTVFRARGVAFGDVDFQLFLFNAAGFGLLANDDQADGNALPALFPAASDGSFVLTTPGVYYLGVAGKGNIPLSTPAGLPIFSFATATEISGPDGPGGAFVHSAWGGPESFGTYRVELLGAFTAPAPGAAGLLVIAGVAVGRRRRGG